MTLGTRRLVPGGLRLAFCGRFVSEKGRQASPSSGDSGSDCPRGEFETFRDFAVVEPELIPQDNGCAELLGELGQRGVEDDSVGDAGAQRRLGVGALSIGPAVVFVDQSGCGSSSATAELIEAGVGRDPVVPRREFRLSGEARQPLGDRDQGFLGGVERIGVVACKATTDGVDAVVVAAQERVQRALIPSVGRFDERLIGEFRADISLGRAQSRKRRPREVRRGCR